MNQLAPSRSSVARLKRLPPGFSVASIAFATLACPLAEATTWQVNDDWSLTTNSTFTLGSSWALRNADPGQLTVADARSIGKRGEGVNYSADDGKLNFDKGDTISQIFKGLTEFDLNDGQQGAFVRFKYWYDHAYETGNGDFTRFDDSGWQDLAKFQGFEVLDLYGWKNFEVNDRQLNVKLGKQVLSWGEALFLQNGINAINPLDASAFNRPGVELKEGQLPVEMLSFSYDLADTLSLEGFYQYNFRPSVLDGCGTFFSVSDNTQEGCRNNKIIVNPAGNLTTDQAIRARAYETRGATDWPSDGGQYGLALRKTLESLNDAELGIYYANYHSRTPLANGTVRTTLGPGTLPSGTYNTVYPENIRLFGISLNGVVGTTAVFSELSYRPNQPLSFNASDVVAAIAGSGASTPIYDGVAPPLGSEVQGYTRKKVWQYIRLEVRREGSAQPTDAALDCFYRGVYIRLFERQTGLQARHLLQRLELTRQPPADPGPWQSLGVPVAFGCPCSALVFKSESWTLPLPGANPHLLAQLEQPILKHLAHLGLALPLTALHARLAEMLTDAPKIEELAQALDISAQVLRHNLSEQGLTFSQLLDQAREAHALVLLANPNLSLDQVASKLGFSSASSLVRAFRRWQHNTPLKYRRQLLEAHP